MFNKCKPDTNTEKFIYEFQCDSWVVFRKEPGLGWAVIGTEAVDSMMARFFVKPCLLLATDVKVVNNASTCGGNPVIQCSILYQGSPAIV